MARTGSVPKATVRRLTDYLRTLERLHETGLQTITSVQIGSVVGVSPAVVRSDMLYADARAGRRGVGYTVDSLIARLREVLGTDQVQPVVVIGMGNLGQAVSKYQGFAIRGFKIVGLFDADPSKVGVKVGGRPIRGMNGLESIVRRYEVRLAILTVPARSSPEVARMLGEIGIQGVLSFSPVPSPGALAVGVVDLGAELERISFSVRANATHR